MLKSLPAQLAAALALPFLLSLVGCSFSGEMGVATFKMEGGVSSSVGGGWAPEEKIALQTVFSVAAQADEAVFPVDLRSQNEDLLISVFAEDEPTSGDTGFFQAIGEGRTAIELISAGEDELLDFFTVDVAAAQEVHLVSSAVLVQDGSSPTEYVPFGIVESIPVTLDIALIDANGSSLNHHHVVTAESADPTAIEAVAGGSIVLLEGVSGSTTVTHGATEQSASTTLSVHSLSEDAVTQLSLREVESENCREGVVELVADLATDEGMPVLGYPVSWSVEGGELRSQTDASVTLEFASDELTPVRVTATAGTLEAEFVADRNETCPGNTGGCSQAETRKGHPSGLVSLLLLLVVTLFKRRRGRVGLFED